MKIFSLRRYCPSLVLASVCFFIPLLAQAGNRESQLSRRDRCGDPALTVATDEQDINALGVYGYAVALSRDAQPRILTADLLGADGEIVGSVEEGPYELSSSDESVTGSLDTALRVTLDGESTTFSQSLLVNAPGDAAIAGTVNGKSFSLPTSCGGDCSDRPPALTSTEVGAAMRAALILADISRKAISVLPTTPPGTSILTGGFGRSASLTHEECQGILAFAIECATRCRIPRPRLPAGSPQAPRTRRAGRSQGFRTQAL